MDNGFFSFANRFGDIVFLNVIFLLTCIPIVTIGPALAALYSVSLKMAKGQEGYVVRGYFTEFKENLKQGLAVGIVLEMILAVLIADAVFLYHSQDSYRTFGMVVTIIALIFLVVLIPYIFALMGRYQNSIKNTVLNSILISISKLPYTILSLILMVIPIVLVMLTPYAYFYVLFGGVVVCTLLQSKLFNRIFAQIEEKNTEKDTEK